MENKEFYEEYMKLFLVENGKVNLISKNDEKYLWEKHVFDSLALELFFNKYNLPENILDIGTGGGFPALPIALTYPNITVDAVDSIRKKINAITLIKNELNIKNLNPYWDRVENINKKYDLVVSRAVASLDKISDLALPKTKSDGYFVAFKSKKTEDEIESAKKIIAKHNSKIIDIIEYELPLKEKLIRNLVVIKKN